MAVPNDRSYFTTQWREGIDAKTAETTKLDEFISFKMKEYEEYDLLDEDLWEQFREDFATFTDEFFDKCHQPSLKQMRTLLRIRGVFVKVSRGLKASKALANVLQEEDPEEWTAEEVANQRTKGGFVSPVVNNTFPINVVPSTSVPAYSGTIRQGSTPFQMKPAPTPFIVNEPMVQPTPVPIPIANEPTVQPTPAPMSNEPQPTPTPISPGFTALERKYHKDKDFTTSFFATNETTLCP